jgi:nucleotide-binding universal stress UspA family protein
MEPDPEWQARLEEASDQFQELKQKAAEKVDSDVPFNWMLRATHDVGRAIQDSIRRKDINLLVMGWPSPRRPASAESPLGKTLRWVLERLLCDLLLVRLDESADRLDFSTTVVPVRARHRGMQSKFAVETARTVAAEERGHLHFVHVAYEGEDVDLERLGRLAGLEPEEIVVVRAPKHELSTEDVVEGVLQYATEVQATALVVGSTEEGIISRQLQGSVPRELAKRFHGTFLLTKRYSGAVRSYLQEFFGSRPTEHLSDVETLVERD